MIENQAFQDLAKLTVTIIQNIIETRYIAKRDEFTNLTKDLIRNPKDLQKLSKMNLTIINGISENYPIVDDPWNILYQFGTSFSERKQGLVNLGSSINNLKRSIEVIEDVQNRLTEHAGFGIAVAVSLHEITKLTTNFYKGISYLIDSGHVNGLDIENLRDTSLTLRSELKRLSPLRTVRNEQRKEFNITKSIDYALAIYNRKLENEHITVVVNANKDIVIYARYAMVNQILSNLIDNSIYWLSVSNIANKMIVIELNTNDRCLIFADNGVGIDSAIHPYLFEPGYSMKIPPSGLGLYICKSYMISMGGSIYETHNKDRIKNMPGAQFTLDFSSIAVNKETVK